jgi:hypothetical protein
VNPIIEYAPGFLPGISVSLFLRVAFNTLIDLKESRREK